ncbi:myoD family inhibitor [Esox lucius]|uniref:MyoD family inhibitor n=1 Tax=Esox lucius TaxID=8010 RepID=A0AAY5K7P4_ESOLU|nr:myoD family inhibitor [Esox lucius]
MDEERKPPVSSPKSPDDGDPCLPTSNEQNPTETPASAIDVHGSLDPLIERPKVKPEVLLGDKENGNNNNSLSQPDLTTPSKSITCQPQARSTPMHPTQPCLTPPSNQLRHGAKAHTHTPHIHNNGWRNGCPRDHPHPGSLPRAASSSSTSSSGTKNPKELQSNPSITSQSSKRSKSSSKSNSSQIPVEAQDDCCVHCILACLFCEFLTLCNMVLDCATCGSCAGDDSSCFCCCCASEECGDCELPCDMDCGIIDACCESADCLEICMECCGLCFSS